MKSKGLGIFILVVLFILFVTGAIAAYKTNLFDSFLGSMKKESGNEDSFETSSGNLFELENSLSVPNQAPSMMVNISTALLSSGGFVVIHEDASDEPGVVIASSQFLPTGTYEDIYVQMPKTTQDGKSYFAILYKDNGDQQFTSDDDPFMDSEGFSVQTSFIASSTSEVE
jgi:hypothetical protein